MLKVLKDQDQKQIEARLIELGYSELAMMEGLAEQMAVEIEKKLEAQSFEEVVFLVGPGNNGADALAIARRLNARRSEKICVLAMPARAPLNELQRRLIQDFSNAIHVKELNSQEIIQRRFEAVLWVEGLFGLSSQLKDASGELLECLEAFSKRDSRKQFVVSVDLVAGLCGNGERSETFSPLIADETLCVISPKWSQLQGLGPDHSGKLKSFWIGAEAESFDLDCSFLKADAATKSFLKHDLELELCELSVSSHKKERGVVTILGGSLLSGLAPTLSAKASLCSGSGYARVLSKDLPIQEDSLGEWLNVELGDESFSQALEDSSCWVLGPGVPAGGWKEDQWQQQKSFFERLLKMESPLVIDGGGLCNVASLIKEGSFSKKLRAVFTPHPKEATEMLAILQPEARKPVARRELFASLRAELRKAGLLETSLVLKGAYPIMGLVGEDEFYVFDLADEALASAGSGDVLSGLIASMMHQHQSKALSLSALLLAHCVQAQASRELYRGSLAREMAVIFGRLWNDLREEL